MLSWVPQFGLSNSAPPKFQLQLSGTGTANMLSSPVSLSVNSIANGSFIGGGLFDQVLLNWDSNSAASLSNANDVRCCKSPGWRESCRVLGSRNPGATPEIQLPGISRWDIRLEKQALNHMVLRCLKMGPCSEVSIMSLLSGSELLTDLM